MSDSKTTPAGMDAPEWARRQKNNARLGYVFGGVAVVLFLIAIWKYRPL